ncbi:hypothetical protein M569_12400, partial [Genlisea aurea]
SLFTRNFRSDASLEALRKASEDRTPNVVLYNYPSFSGAYGALFAHLYHSRLDLPCLILPFSAVLPFSVEDLCIEGLNTCYLLDFFGPKFFSLELFRRTSCRIVGFDHRKSMLSRLRESDANVALHLDNEKNSSSAAYTYFSAKLSETISHDGDCKNLLNHEEQERLNPVVKYIEDRDLRRWSLPDIKPFNIGLRKWHSMLNCVTNPSMFHQLMMEICLDDVISAGKKYISCRQMEANNLLQNVFRLRLGRGFYGECLGVRTDGNSNFVDEMGKELSRRSSAAGLRPIGAVIYMQRNNLKMCLRTMDSNTDTSQIAKVVHG